MSKVKISFFVLILFFVSYSFRKKLDEPMESLRRQSVFIPPSIHIKKMTFGFDEVVANSLWIRWIQNIETCGKNLISRSNLLNKVNLVESELSKEITQVQKKMVCNEGWAFRMLDAVTDLSPKFRMPYALGAASLSVIAEDHIGAKKIYEKALVNYPKDWKILYRGAYHFLFELNDLSTAGKWLKMAADNGAPDWLYSLSSKVSTKAGKLEFGIRVLEDYIKVQTNPKYINSLKKRLEKLKSQL